MINIIDNSLPFPPAECGATKNPDRATLLAFGWRDEIPQPPIAEGYTRIWATYHEGDGIIGQWDVVDRPTSEIEAESRAADLALNGTRYALQNQYLSLCDQLTGGTTHAKLGFAELEAIIKGLMATDPSTAVALSLQLLTLNAALVREGGVNWWDGCAWRDLS